MLGSDYEELETRAHAGSALKKLGAQEFPSLLSTEYSVKCPSVKVLFNGKVIIVGDLTGMYGTKDITVLRTKSGSYGIVVRPKDENTVSSLMIHKETNLFDLLEVAKAANVDVALSYIENEERRAVNIGPVREEIVQTVTMKLLKDAGYPQGRYVLLDDDGNCRNVTLRHDSNLIGNASAAQILLYAKFIAESYVPSEALNRATSEKLKAFLKKTRRVVFVR